MLQTVLEGPHTTVDVSNFNLLGSNNSCISSRILHTYKYDQDLVGIPTQELNQNTGTVGHYLHNPHTMGLAIRSLD